MKVEDVPQDQDPTFEGQKKICYATGADGRYVQVETSGWEIEAEAKALAWQAIDSDVETCRQRIQRGAASPLEYFMKLRQMDPSLLAANVGAWTWQVKWHLRSRKFRRLSVAWLQRYAAELDVPVNLLRDFKGEPL
jgi:hypothetical protein